MNLKTNSCGQALIEFILSVPLLAALLFGAFELGLKSWRHIHCVHQLFEAAISERSTLKAANCPLGKEEIRLPQLPEGTAFLDDKGAIGILALLLFVVISTGGFGIWGLFHHQHQIAKLQFRLDHCIAPYAIAFRDSLAEIETLNSRLNALRLSLATALVTQPELAPTLRGTLQLTSAQQEVVLTKWRLRSALSRPLCAKVEDTVLPLPALQYTRLPPDPLGPKPLQWTGRMPESWTFELKTTHTTLRRAALTVRRKINEIPSQHFTLAWSHSQ